MLSKARRDDVVGLVGAYENGLYGLQSLRSSTGYESRRRAAPAEVESAKLKAAAPASATAFVPIKPAPGKTTEGAPFLPPTPLNGLRTGSPGAPRTPLREQDTLEQEGAGDGASL